mgnify:CR=1 FL=1
MTCTKPYFRQPPRKERQNEAQYVEETDNFRLDYNSTVILGRLAVNGLRQKRHGTQHKQRRR